ncbi:MAG: glycosyltransferase family 2 protein [Promethearchaeota archaeon]
MLEVCIGIPVYNEAGNIYSLCVSLLNQKGDGWRIKRIIVVNDGSTDDTLNRIKYFEKGFSGTLLARKIKLEIISLEQNIGKANALNIIFEKARTSVLVLLDSDVVLCNPSTIDTLLKGFENSSIGLVGGWSTIHISSKIGFVERAMRFSVNFLEKAGYYGNNILCAWGGLMAIARDIYKRIELPTALMRIDAFLYLCTMKLGKRFRFIPSAKVVVKLAKKNPYWFIKIQRRVRRFPRAFRHCFSGILEEEYSSIPISTLVKRIISQFLESPLDGLFYITAKLMSSIINSLFNIQISHRWRS